jgi:ABC-type amino acid transport system permease subunit
VDKGQWEAAKSIGLSNTHVMTRVILPQAVKNILPALGNEFISTVKGTSLASVFFVGELMTSYKSVQSATFLALQSLTIVGVIYFMLNFLLSKLLKLLERRLMVSD